MNHSYESRRHETTKLTGSISWKDKDVAIKIHTCLDAAKATVAIAQTKSISFARAVLGRIAWLNTKIFFCVCAGAVFGLNAYKMSYIFLSNITVWLYLFYRDTSEHHTQRSLTEIKLRSAILKTKQDRYGSEKKKVGSYAHCKQSRDITKIKRMTSHKSNACQIILEFYTICKANHHVVNNEFGPTRKCFLLACIYFTT